MRRRAGGRKRRRRDEEEEEEGRVRKRGKEEASESDEEEEEEEGEDEEEPLWTGEGDPLHGEAWTEEEDAWLITLRTYVHRSGLKLSWSHVAERMPNRSKHALQTRWKKIASEHLRRKHALQVRGEQKAWDEAEEEQLRELKRQGVSDEDIASRLGRSVASVQGKWRRIGSDSEKQQLVQFTRKEDKLVSVTLFQPCSVLLTLFPQLLRLASKRPPLSWRQIARRFHGRSVSSLKSRLRHLKHSAHQRTGAWTRGEQLLVKAYVAAGGKKTLIAKRLGTRTPQQVNGYVRRTELTAVYQWRAEEDEWLRSAVAAAKSVGVCKEAEWSAWSRSVWCWVGKCVGRGWMECKARVDVLEHMHKKGFWAHSEVVRLARVMLLPRSERAADFHVELGRTKQQCTKKWRDMKRKNPALLASVVAEATADDSAGSSSSSAAAASPVSRSPAVSALTRALSAMGPRARLLYSLRSGRC